MSRLRGPGGGTAVYTRLMNLYRYSPVFIPLLNPTIRWLQKTRARRDIFAVRRYARAHQAAIDSWLEGRQLFFGFGVYRSGTTFLAALLNATVAEAVVVHEPNVHDYWHYPLALQDEAEARSYISGYRLAEIHRRVAPLGCSIYGEINPYLRRHCGAVRRALPAARLFHVVRDGRSVVRSLMSRELLGRKDPVAPRIRPPAGDPYRDRWQRMSRFARICWLWRSDNAFIRRHVDRAVLFDRLRRDYDYFREALLDPLGVAVDRESWERRVGRVENPTPSYRMPPYEQWQAGQKREFAEICGAEMERYGFDY